MRKSRAFFRNHAAVTALFLLLAIILFCIVYPFFSEFDYRAINFAERLELPRGGIRWAPTRWGAT